MNNSSQLSTTKRMNTRTKLALWLIVSPTLLFILSFSTYGLVNHFTSQPNQSAVDNSECQKAQDMAGPGTDIFCGDPTADPQEEAFFSATSITKTPLNAGLFVITLVAFVSWLPGLSGGIVLIATKPRTTIKKT